MNLMSRITSLFRVSVLTAIILISGGISQDFALAKEKQGIVVEIDYGNIQPAVAINVPQAKGRTALELLQAVAEVKTHPVGEYVFVTAINGVEAKRGEMAWYYQIDGKPADKLAYSNLVDTANYLKWEYKKDRCSAKVDNEKK